MTAAHRICAIGNSHMAAAKLGWDQVAAEYPGYHFDFFGFPPGTSVAFESHVKLRHGALVAVTDTLKKGFQMTSGGRTEIDLSAYSAFVFFGMGVGGPHHVANAICPKHRLMVHAGTDSHLISEACLSAAIEGRLTSDAALAPVRTIREVSAAPIIQQANPVPTERIVCDPVYEEDAASVPGFMAYVRPIFDSMSSEVARHEGYIYLSQPEATLDSSGLTKDEYISEGVGFGAFARGGAKRTNASHGNRPYGVEVVRQLIALMDSSDLAAPSARKAASVAAKPSTATRKGTDVVEKANAPEGKVEKRRMKAIRDRLKEMTEERKKLTEELAGLREKVVRTASA